SRADGGGRTRVPGAPGASAARARAWSGVDGRAGPRPRPVGMARAVRGPAAPRLAVAPPPAGGADARRRRRARSAEPDRPGGTGVPRAAREPRPGRRGTRWRRTGPRAARRGRRERRRRSRHAVAGSAARGPVRAARAGRRGAACIGAGADGKASAAWAIAARLAPRDETVRRARELLPPPDAPSEPLFVVGFATPGEWALVTAVLWGGMWMVAAGGRRRVVLATVALA